MLLSTGLAWGVYLGIAGAIVLVASSARVDSKALEKLVVDVNAMTPKELSTGLFLTGASSDESNFSYLFKFATKLKSEISPTFVEVAKPMLHKEICINRDQVRLLNSEFDIHYVYMDKDDHLIADISFTKSDCP